MSVLFKKTIAASLILGLVFPLTGQGAANTTLNSNVTIKNDNPSRNNAPTVQGLPAAESTTPQTNLNSVAPTYSQQSGNQIITTTPQIDLLGQKKEGRWSFGVARYSETANSVIKYDATGPKCPPAPTINEYNNKKDYYASNGFYNPWPRGLDGQWTNDIIYFENDDPSLCRDQITVDTKTYVQRNYTPNNCSGFTYDEDQTDCNANKIGMPTTLTLPLAQMAGCKRTDTISVGTHKVKQDFFMFDKVDNSALCFAPEAQIDRNLPVITSLQAEHVGLGLAKETLSTDTGNRTNYRADDGPLLLHANIKDLDADTKSGRSGLNWQPIINDPAIDLLKKDIRTAENQLNVYKSNAVAFESDIILKRSDILAILASIQKHKVTNNLLHKISADINIDTNFFMQALGSLTPGLNNLSTTNINENGLTNIQSILNRSKFDTVVDISTYRSTVDSINPQLINTRKGSYTTELPLLLNRAQVTEVGAFQSLTSTTNEFNKYYNQWQIDKTKNYSNVLPTWNQSLLNIDQTLNALSQEFQAILAAYNIGELRTLAQKLAEIIPQSQVLSILVNTETSAAGHAADQSTTIQSLQQANTTIQSTIDYLNNFDNSVDTFDSNIITQLVNVLNKADNDILGIQGDLKDTQTPGTLAESLYQMSVIENTGELGQLLNLENQDIRDLQALLVVKKRELDTLKSSLQTKTDSIIALENSILTMRSDLATLIEAQNAASSASGGINTDLNAQRITHIEIERTNSASNKIQQFFPPSIEPDNGNNFIWDINSFKFEGESAPIFTVSGDYKIAVVVFDKATNKSIKEAYIRIHPAKLEINVNSSCNNASNIPYADNTETCNLILPQLDRFGNKIQSNQEIQIMARDQDVNGSYDLVKSLGANFVNGLRFVGGSNSGKQNLFTWTPNNQASKIIQLKSLLPTLSVTVYGADPDYAIGYDVSDGIDVAFILKHPNIGPRGIALGSPNIDTLNIPVRFKSWVNLTAKGSQGAFTNRGWNPPIANPFNVYVEADTNSSKKLPTDFVVNVTGFVGSSYEFNNQNLAKPGQSIAFNNVNAAYTESTGNGGQPAPFATTINSISALSSQQSSRALFIPKVAYQVNSKNIILPGVPAGSCPNNDPQKCFVINPPVEMVDINISNASSNEPGNLNFTINLSAPLHQALTIYLKAEHITTQNGDFVMPAQNFVTIPAGSLSAAFSVAVPKYQAGEVEANETMRLSVQNVDKPELINQSTPGIGTIYDQDNALSIENAATIEGARCMFSLSINRPATQDIIVTTQYGRSSDSAQGGIGKDYDNRNGVFTIPAGQTKVIAPIQTYEDDIAEGTENVTFVVQNVQGGNLSALTSEATCTIEDNDIEPNIYLSNTTVNEGDNAPITVTLGENTKSGRPDNEDVVVRLRTYEINSSTLSNATKDLDYVHKTFDVMIPANQKSVTVTPSNGIVTKADDLIEGDEYLGVEIVGIPNGAKVGARDAKALITIRDKSELPPKPSIVSITGETGYETIPTDTVKFTVTLDTKNNTGAPINLTLNLEDDTATGGIGQDYDNTPVTVSIPNGEKFGVSTPIEIYNDNIVEETELFKAVVASGSVSPSGALVGTFPTGTASIEDKNIPPIDITIEDSLACESSGCANTEDNVMNFEVRLSTPHLDANNPLIVSYEPSKVTPMANDYFAAGTYTATFNYLDKVAQLEPVPLINNIDVDGDKEFEMHFKAVESNHASLIGDTSDTAKGTIQDDDSTAKPEIIITEDSDTEGRSAIIKVGLTTPAIDETTITLTTRNISTENADYICLPEELTVIFGVGEMEAQNVQCDLIIDKVNEPDEQFEIGVGSVTGTIKPGGDNDKGIITIMNYQTLDLVMEKPPVFMENLAGGVAEFVMKLKDNGQPLGANQVLEQPLTFTVTPSDLDTGYGFAKGGSNFSINGIDYKNAIQTVNLEPGKGFGKTAYTLSVDINNDSVIEFNPDSHSSPENEQESFGMSIDTISDNVASITTHDAIIEDEDSTSCADKPKVKVVDDSRVEGEDLQFYVALDRSLCPGQSVTLDFEAGDNSAEAPGDYQAKTVSLTFKNDRSGKPASQMIRVSTIDDTEDENDESLYLRYLGATPSDLISRVERFSVRPSDASHRNRGSVSVNGIAAIGSLIDNDTAKTPSPTITIGDAMASEGEDLLYEIKLSETNKGETIEAEFEATPGDPNTTTADFSSNQIENGKILATMVIKSGEQIGTLKTTTIQPAIIHTTENSITDEPDKKVYLDFLRRVYGRLQTTGIAGGLGLIKDDDIAISKPSVTISDGAANEGEDITFTISLENTGSGTNVAPRGGINFTVVTSHNAGPNAAKNNEFGKGKIVSLPAGDSSVSFRIETFTDDEPENTENFNVQIQASDVGTFLGNAADITSGKVNGTGMINDASPTDECITYGINCPATEILLPGSAIEGQIIADKMECFDAAGNKKDNCDITNDDSVVLGVSTIATDVREAITRNAYELIRGRTAANVGDIPNNTKGEPIIKRNDFIKNNGKRYPRWDIYVDDLPDGGVTYLDGDLNGDGQITGNEGRVYFRLGKHRSNGAKGTLNDPVRVKGKHTFIIQNASLNIIGDMVYDTPDSSLGIMVINDSIDDLDNLNRRGQLTVYKDVKHIVGALFTDGSLVSNVWDEAGAGAGRVSDAKNKNSKDDWDIINNDSRLGRQLILTGNILSKNTIGKADKAIPEGPWGDLTQFPVKERLPRAQMYDFNYIRRYVPVYESPGVLDSASKNRCSKVPGESQCYSNTKSFIIRVDPRLRENPPPGFQADSIQSLR